MKKLTDLCALCFLFFTNTLQAVEPEKVISVEEQTETTVKKEKKEQVANDDDTIAIPRFVLAFDYKFSSKWILGAEIEFEAGGVGIETELENSENGE